MTAHARVLPATALEPDHVRLWDAYLDGAEFQSPFLSARWAGIVGSVRDTARVAVIEDADGVAGFFPFEIDQSMLRTAHRIGGHLADCCGVVGAPTLRVDPTNLLRDAGIEFFTFDHLPDKQGAHGLTAGRAQTGLRIQIDGDRPYWQRATEHNKPFVRKIAAGERQLAADCGELRFEYHTGDIARELDNVIARKRAQYARTRVRDGLKPDWTRRLLALAAASSDDRCAGVLSTLYAGDRWVASSLALRCHDVLHEWMPVYDPALRRYGPGHVLRRHIIEHCAAHGISTLDFGEGQNPHKAKYVVSPYTMSKGRWTVPGWRAFTAAAIQSMVWRLTAFVR